MTILRRWREGGGDATDDRIGGMLRQVADPPPLGEARLDRVAAALGGPRRSRRLPGLRWAVVASLVLGTGGVVFARHELARFWEVVRGRAEPEPVRRPVEARKISAAPVVARPETPRPSASTDQGPTPPAVVERPVARFAATGSSTRPSPSPSPGRRPEPEPDPVRIRSGSGSGSGSGSTSPASVAVLPSAEMLAPIPVSSAPAPSSAALAPAPPLPGLGDEARLLRRALEELRHARDPRAALAALDEHRAHFPTGLLRADADFLRVEVLLALDRDGDALALLEHLDLSASPRADELRVTRGELRAARDCTRALDDFDRVLGGAPPPAVLERALRGRAVCSLRLSDGPGAQAALRAYLERFPGGPFAAEARRRLQAPR